LIVFGCCRSESRTFTTEQSSNSQSLTLRVAADRAGFRQIVRVLSMARSLRPVDLAARFRDLDRMQIRTRDERVIFPLG